ncbi:MAG: insulinase family protein [Oscillospiraceae bacterium]|nr:insulinase family protein [Oscillospiraceae bacterium]
MSNLINRRKIADGAYFNSVSDPRYKFNRITVGFFAPLSEDRASAYALIPRILHESNVNYPAMKDFNNFLASLYRAKTDYEIESFGDDSFLGISMTFMDDKFALHGEDITAIAVKTLFDCLFRPALDESGVFRAAVTETCKRLQVETIEAEINDKRSYAAAQAKREMYAGEPAAVNHLGSVAKTNAATPETLYAAYKALLQTAVIEVMCVGCNDFAGAFDIAQKEFAEFLGERKNLTQCKTHYSVLKSQVAEKTERMAVNQSKMVLGFKVNHALDSREKAALGLMSNLYGGTISSKLFLNVRERLSLCYYCWSRLNKYKGAMYVSCGVEECNIEKAKAEILLQLENVKTGDFTDDELNNALLSELNNIKTVNDDLCTLTWWYITRIYAGEIKSPEEFLKNYEGITREEVTAAARAVGLDTFYVLSGTETIDN